MFVFTQTWDTVLFVTRFIAKIAVKNGRIVQRIIIYPIKGQELELIPEIQQSLVQEQLVAVLEDVTIHK